jgi:hypothetical protein
LPAATQDRQVDMHSGVYGCTSIQAVRCNPLPVVHTKYYLGHQIEKNEMVGTRRTYGVYRVLVGKYQGKKPLGRPRHRGEDNIKMDL